MAEPLDPQTSVSVGNLEAADKESTGSSAPASEEATFQERLEALRAVVMSARSRREKP
jgi:hypothetical protein